jgi:hypothetical protein
MQVSLRSHDWIVESIAEAVAIGARRLLPLLGLLVAAVALIRLVAHLPNFQDPFDKLYAGIVQDIVTLMYWLVTAMSLVAAPVCIAERAGVRATLSRCRFLTNGHRWQIFGAISLVSIVDLSIVSIWRAGAVLLSPIGQGVGVLIMNYAVIEGIWYVLGAFNAVMAAVFYDRLRLSKDGVDVAKIFD